MLTPDSGECFRHFTCKHFAAW